MKIEEIKTNLVERFNKNKKTIIGIILLFAISGSLGGFVTYQIMQKQIEIVKDIGLYHEDKKLHEEIKNINKALDDLKKNKPVTEKVVNNTTTEIRYVEKETPEDPDVDIQSPEPVAKVKYNTETYEIPMETKTNTTAEKDGTVKVNQTHEMVIDVSKVADQHMASYKLMMEEKERELNEELKEVKKDNRNLKITGTAAGIIGAGYLLHKAFK